MTRDNYEPVPAIVRDVDSEKDGETRIPKYGEKPDKIIHQPRDTVTHQRGWGDSGPRVQVVNHDCPECGFDRMIRRVDVSPERRNEVRYWCLMPNCVHFVRDSLSHACHGNYPQRDTQEPAVFEAKSD
jgi:predicted RNA-binding Zn-ribbon protein involved in translation (DUF1610 family)